MQKCRQAAAAWPGRQTCCKSCPVSMSCDQVVRKQEEGLRGRLMLCLPGARERPRDVRGHLPLLPCAEGPPRPKGFEAWIPQSLYGQTGEASFSLKTSLHSMMVFQVPTSSGSWTSLALLG